MKGLGELMAMQCDVSKEADVVRLFGRIQDQFGGVDICINNAGVLLDAPILTGSTSDWQTMFDVRLHFILCLCTTHM